MPQMMPLNWMMEFWFFIMIFLSLNSFVYYIFIQKFSSFKNKYNLKINWKW
uniref:ATP synthase F0 subunit 8 n=1 Tax=Cucujoidea sp. 7 KM-2017 TaxID=2219388 RepID=A0A346RH05_9CUCU|nr:ATP synthase F0 subunit 8 [Cucujoidea sp. 7 KM-2017]